MKSFWESLPSPFTVLAPMDGVTDAVFRRIIAEIGKPDVLYTEFVSCERILYGNEGRNEEQLVYGANEQPIIAQVWGTDPDTYFRAAGRIRELGFAGIDINMGCPVRAVIKNGACSALIRTPELAARIIDATVRGSGGLPVSVKTRIGIEKEEIDTWIRFLLQQHIQALAVHLRTVSEESKVDAHWELMPRILAIRDEVAPMVKIIGNGDIPSLDDIHMKYTKYGCEGFMVGTGIFTNPWLFSKTRNMEDVTVPERLDLYMHHIELFKEVYPAKAFGVLKKFGRIYIKHFTDSAMLREQLMLAETLEELEGIITSYRQAVVE